MILAVAQSLCGANIAEHLTMLATWGLALQLQFPKPLSQEGEQREYLGVT